MNLYVKIIDIIESSRMIGPAVMRITCRTDPFIENQNE